MSKENLFPFSSQTWRKINGQTLGEFHRDVKTGLDSLIKAGYNVEIIWLNENGSPCQNEKEQEASIICVIKENNAEKDMDKITADDNWRKEQLDAIEKMKNNSLRR